MRTQTKYIIQVQPIDLGNLYNKLFEYAKTELEHRYRQDFGYVIQVISVQNPKSLPISHTTNALKFEVDIVVNNFRPKKYLTMTVENMSENGIIGFFEKNRIIIPKVEGMDFDHDKRVYRIDGEELDIDDQIEIEIIDYCVKNGVYSIQGRL